MDQPLVGAQSHDVAKVEAGKLDSAKAPARDDAEPSADGFKKAIVGGEASKVVCMLEQRADVNHKYQCGLTPLHFAAIHGHTGIACSLLPAKADPGVATTDENACTALDIAKAEGATQIIAALEAALEDEANRFKAAIIAGDTDAVQYMIRHVARVNHSYVHGLTPLHFACLHRRVAVAKALLGAKALPRRRTTDHRRLTPKMMAEEGGNIELVDLLSQACKGEPTEVLLHIYELGSKSAVRIGNKVFRLFGTGLFHVGVEVHGAEWSYGWTPPTMPTGVFRCAPRACEAHTFRETVTLGTTGASEEEITSILRDLSVEWQGERYDFLRHNCTHFCAALCAQIGVGRMPGWVSSMAALGASLDRGVRAVCVMLQVKVFRGRCGRRLRLDLPVEEGSLPLSSIDGRRSPDADVLLRVFN